MPKKRNKSKTTTKKHNSLKDKTMKKYEAYATLFVLSIIFTIIDIVVSSCQLPVPSLIFSTITMVIGFIGAHKSKTLELETKYDKSVEFINKNFNKANIILNVLDVVCCVIGVLTGVFALLLIFRVTIALRIAVYINKYRSVAFAIWGVVFMHIFKMKKGEKKMTKNTVLQNILWTIIAVFGLGGIVVTAVPEFMGVATIVTKVCGIVADSIAVIGGIWLGGTSDKVMSEEEIKAVELKIAEKQVKKETKHAEKTALKDAKKEFKLKKEAELKALAEQKLKENQEKNISVAKEV